MNEVAIDTILTNEVLSRIAAPTAEGTGLPNACYTSEAWLALERQRLFRHTWNLAGFRRDVPKPGDATPASVAGMPLLIVCDEAGEIRVFHNACRHRGAVLVGAACSGKKILSCPYHGWSYGLDGQLRTRPHFHGAGRHDVISRGDARAALVPVRHAVWNDLIFVDIGGAAPPFEEHWAPFAKRTPTHDFAAMRHAKTLTFDVQGNWKLIHENFFDPYHVPTVHPRLEQFSPLSTREHVVAEGAWLIGTNPITEPQDGRGVGMPYYPGLDATARRTEWFFHLFPTISIEIWPDQFAVFQLDPVAPGRTIEYIHLYFAGEAATDRAHAGGRQGVYDMWNELNTEDFKIVESMQVARTSPGFDGGVLSPYWDGPTQRFAQLVVDAVSAS